MNTKVTNMSVFSLFNLYSFTTIIAFMLCLLLDGSAFSTPAATIAGAILGCMMAYPAYKVGMSRPGEFLGNYGHELVGKIPHYTFMIYFLIVNLIITTIDLRQLSDFLLAEYLNGTPGWAIVFIFMICLAYVVYCGIETIFLVAQGIFLINALIFLIIPFFAYQELEMEMFNAFVTHLQLKDFSFGMIKIILMFGQLGFLFLLFPYLKKPEKTFRTFVFTACSATVILLAHVISVLLTFGPELAANLMYPAMDLVRFVRVGSFIETFDPILIILFLTSVFVKISFNLFLCVLCLSHITGVKECKSFALPVSAFVGAYSLVVIQTQPELVDFLEYEFIFILVVAEFLIPWLYWIMLLIRTHMRKAKPAG
ncbi:GerAB/ArcD/ProY family transporter [Paenibacillus antibioticophila]|uniref:GerAB/ArcD/ProY family transporter n=1 Tax=Paenibacillus antibioticophila TaxID=1274374 RepID=UPI0005CB3676|nr:GerAB/ArcD/ProY family transporter [Paenibacillus antibioticophila]